MSSSREDSPDWLRSFQAPTRFTTLSSDSEPEKSPSGDDRNGKQEETNSSITVKYDANKSLKKTAKKRVKVADGMPSKREKTGKQKKRQQKKRGSEDDEDVKGEEFSEKQVEPPAPNHLVWALSSDSESDLNATARKKESKEESSIDDALKSVKNEEKNENEESSPKVEVTGKSPRKRAKTENVKLPEKKTDDNMKIEGGVDDMDVQERGIPEKHVEPHVSSSTLPLILPEKVVRCKALVECEGESIDLSGDVGAVGRVIFPEAPSKEPEMFLDLKGTIYKTTIIPSRTFCVVSIGQSEAKIEAIMNDFIQLTPQSNVYDAETMVEGTLDGFSFDSEDEIDKTTKDVKGDQNEGAEEKPNGKSKGKTLKRSGATQKKAKAAAGKSSKKKKPQMTKKGKSKK